MPNTSKPSTAYMTVYGMNEGVDIIRNVLIHENLHPKVLGSVRKNRTQSALFSVDCNGSLRTQIIPLLKRTDPNRTLNIGLYAPFFDDLYYETAIHIVKTMDAKPGSENLKRLEHAQTLFANKCWKVFVNDVLKTCTTLPMEKNIQEYLSKNSYIENFINEIWNLNTKKHDSQDLTVSEVFKTPALVVELFLNDIVYVKHKDKYLIFGLRPPVPSIFEMPQMGKSKLTEVLANSWFIPFDENIGILMNGMDCKRKDPLQQEFEEISEYVVNKTSAKNAFLPYFE